jgi:hypothetical protein
MIGRVVRGGDDWLGYAGPRKRTADFRSVAGFVVLVRQIAKHICPRLYVIPCHTER